MKRLFFTSMLLASVVAVQAQTSSTHRKEDSEERPDNAESGYNGISISLNKRKIVFADVPKTTRVVITNMEGEVVKDTKVSPSDFVVDVRSLDKGTYFIKLYDREESKKGFVLNL